MNGPRDAYKVLQVDPEADLEVIQAAYRRLAQKYHPDRAETGSDSASRMVEINAAWEELRDPARRSAYDRERARSVSSVASPPASHARDERPNEPATPRGDRAQTAGGMGPAGPPPGRPSGSVLNFGRYSGWSLGEIGRVDPAYLEWLDRMPIGRPHRDELDALLRRIGARMGEQAEANARRGLFRRR
jgi:curved DNA-binding protein CbpA